MPTYLSRKPDGIYIFRRSVPSSLRKFLGKTEIKKSLGSNFSQARKKCNEWSVETDRQFEEARKPLTRTPLKSLNLNDFYDKLEVVNEVTPSFIQQFRAFLLASADAADFQRRSESFENFPKLEVTEANGGIAPLLKKAISEGDASTFIPVMHQTLHLRGYRLADSLLGTKDEHRLAFEFVRTTQETQHLISTRDNGDYFSVKLSAEPLPQGAKPLEAQPESDKKKLSFFINEFLANWSPNKKSMQSKLVKALTLFKEVTTDLDIDRLRQEHIKDFFRLLHRLPPRWQEAARREALTAK
ncbi:MAG TPA: DUF6538 domain-containing protein, partial [Herbaspirillum sp.]|nr:DUF6538 domain-containing protein [Herbaspirillum sp.]